jgi:peptidoglycan hydrolase CwlO-like protein
MANNQYYITETDVSKMLNLSGLPMQFQNLFARDYVAIKRDIIDSDDIITNLTSRVGVLEDDVDAIDSTIVLLSSRVSTAENDIDDLETRVTAAENDIVTVASDLSTHESSQSAHGSTGDIVGTDDFCTLLVGGTVKLSAAVANATASTVTAVLNPNAAGVAYLQADAATWVAMLNEHKTNINQLKTDLNAAITQINLLLVNSRTALQLAP